MAAIGEVADAAGHADLQAMFVGVQHTGDGSQVRERAMLHRRLAFTRRDAHAHRAFAVELAMRATAHLPQPFHALRDDRVVGTPQGSIGTEAHEGGEHHRG